MKTYLTLLIFAAALGAQTKPATKPAATPAISDKARADYFFVQWKLAQSRLDQIEREKAFGVQTQTAITAIVQSCPEVGRAIDGDLTCPAPAAQPAAAKP